MRALGRFLFRNWPLRLGAILLATVLYSGLVLSQNVRTWTGTVTVDAIRPPPGATLLADLEPVREIRYRAPLDVGVLGPDSFRATVDLSRVAAEPGGPPVEVPVTLVALDRRVQIVDFVPQALQVRLDPVLERQVPVTVSLGTVPDGLDLGTPQLDPSEVTARGASSRVATIRSAVARIAIDGSALNVDRHVELVPVDDQGNHVPNVVLEPARSRIRIAVARQLANRTLPVVPQIVGEVAPGYRIGSISVEPLSVTVSGEEPIVTRMELAGTAPLDVSGRERDFETTIALSLPPQVAVSGPSEVRVTVTIEPETGSRTYEVGLVLSGARSDRAYRLAASHVNVTLSGPVAQLETIDPTQLLATLPVVELDVGRHVVAVAHTPPLGLDVVAISPAEVAVVVEETLDASPSPFAGGHGMVAL